MFHLNDYPSNEPDERLVLTLKRHWFILFKEFLVFLVLAAIPLGIFVLLVKSRAVFFDSPLSYTIGVIGMSMYYLAIVGYLYNGFLDYYLDNWVVTNHRIINIESQNLFNRTVSEQTLYRVQDVTAESKGILPTFLNYGTIYVQTAAEKERFVFRDVPQPFENARLIEQLVGKDRELHKGMV